MVRDKEGNPTKEYKDFQAYHMGTEGPERCPNPPLLSSDSLQFHVATDSTEDEADEVAIRAAAAAYGDAFTRAVVGVAPTGRQ